MYKVIDTIKPGVTTADCAKYWTPAKEKGYPDERYMWCDDLAHGMGLWLYEYPIINRLWSLEHPQTIQKGMTMALEPMLNAGVWRTRVTDNKWTVITADGKLSAHFEHTIAIGDSVPEILTIP
jgi:methionine aminopeptidase